MSKILVLITTDHEDHDEAIKSVSGAMKRAGYNVRDYNAVDRLEFFIGENEAIECDGLVEVVEPEVDDA